MAKKRKQSFNKFDQKKKRKVEEVNAENQEEVKEPTLEEVQPVSKPGQWKNKQKVLIFCSRGVSFKGRHLIDDFMNLMPHAKKDTKFDKKAKLTIANEMCEMRTCNKCIYLEGRKKKDLYMWLSNAPNGPSALFNVQNLNTMEELKFMGNCLKSSRPVLSFDKKFDSEPHMQLLKELFTQVFGTPRYHPKSQPFHDHVLNFTYLNGRVWFRNYQFDENKPGELVEIGPRFSLVCNKIFSGSFGGPVLYINDDYVSPNTVRRQQRQATSGKYTDKTNKRNAKSAKDTEHSFGVDSTEKVFEK